MLLHEADAGPVDLFRRYILGQRSDHGSSNQGGLADSSQPSLLSRIFSFQWLKGNPHETALVPTASTRDPQVSVR